MTYPVPVDLVDHLDWGILGQIPACLRLELDKENSPDLCFTGFMVGARAGALGMANCQTDKPCGVAWVRLTAMYPSTVFPTPDEPGARRCSAPMAYEFEMGVARCAPRAANKQMYPDEQDTFNALRLYSADAQAMKRAILCCLPEAVKKALGIDILVEFGGWTPLEEGNGLAGGIVQGFVGRKP